MTTVLGAAVDRALEKFPASREFGKGLSASAPACRAPSALRARARVGQAREQGDQRAVSKHGDPLLGGQPGAGVLHRLGVIELFKSAEFRRLNFADLIYSWGGFCFYTASAKSCGRVTVRRRDDDRPSTRVDPTRKLAALHPGQPASAKRSLIPSSCETVAVLDQPRPRSISARPRSELEPPQMLDQVADK